MTQPISVKPAGETPASTATGAPFRIALIVFFLGFIAFLVWAAYAPLDEGVPTQGSVTIDTKRKPVQHLSGGLVTEILVREGQMVSQGQPVARLDPAASLASLETEQQNFQGTRAMISSYQEQLKSQRRKQALLQEMLDGMRGLVAEGYAPRNQQLDLERQMADTQVAMTELQGNINRLNAQLLASQQKIKALSDELKRTDLLSPVAGQVVGLTVQSAGAVIKPAEKLMDIVPLDESLLLEARVPPTMIDRVTTGQAVDVRFNAFVHAPALVVEGRIQSLSQDLISENTPNGAVSYYLARVAITPEGQKTLGSRQMQPGMPAEVIIKTGERSMLTYLLHPLIKRMAGAMKEE